MDPSYTYCTNFLFKFLPGFFFLCMISCPESTFGNKSDCLALLDFKRRITEDPFHIMKSWNDSVDLCSWVGVTCNHANKRVVILNLEAQKLVGSIPPSIGNLTYLTGINLKGNNFHGEIPQEIGRLLGLQYLTLSSNSFGGKIPANISHCTQLRMLNIGVNKLIGSIPNQLNSLLNLTHFLVGKNNLTGTIPDWIGNFSSLYAISLGDNNFEGSIPNVLGRLTSLGIFVLQSNKLSGTVPSSIYNISSIYLFAVTQNQLHGELPQNVGTTLPNLELFAGGVNKFTGSIPVSLSNASKLQFLDFAENGLTGKFPAENFGTLKGLVRLNFDDNRLGSGKTGDLSSLSFLANCTNLEVLSFSRNRFGGELPESIGNLSTKLRIFTMGGNLLHGSFPTRVVNLVNLINLGMEQNYLGDDEDVEDDDDGDGYGNKIRERPLAKYKDPGPDKAKRLEECLYSVIQIGISCSAISPGERMRMDVVVNKMGALRDSYLNLRRRRRR
ncbi:hypothetical protein DVH24_036119 [Malus domestica]|uniref:Leucine-rich repeat-containing N-terminal plant-type domain-containing protein n=1 Tax=Malus domestica TaxID=3750 RepID=A0A498IDQ7_MALDO|nr:hypothetical protein DVH24_036119 [Malus domestica]